MFHDLSDNKGQQTEKFIFLISGKPTLFVCVCVCVCASKIIYYYAGRGYEPDKHFKMILFYNQNIICFTFLRCVIPIVLDQ